MVMAILAICAVLLLIGGSLKRDALVLWSSVVFWILLGVFMYGESSYPGTGLWDWQFGMTFTSFFIAFSAALYTVSEYRTKRREKQEIIARELEETKEYAEYSDIFEAEDEEDIRMVRRQQELFDARMRLPYKNKRKKTLEEQRLEIMRDSRRY